MKSQKMTLALKLEAIIGEERDNIEIIKAYYPRAQFYYFAYSSKCWNCITVKPSRRG